MSLILSILEQGLIYAVLSLGIYITYKILDFPDLTVDSSFPFGAAVSAIMISSGINPFVTLPVSFICGALAGLVTGLIHVKCKVRDLLSGIITMTILYSINLHIADGKANIPLFNNDSIFSLSPIKDIAGQFNTVIVVLVISLIAKFLLDLYMKTKSGYLLRAVGDNPTLVTSLAKDSGTVKILGLMVSNALVSLAGCIMCQQQRFFDISMGTGTMVIGLASVIIGTNLFKKVTIIKATTAVFVGSIIYKACVGTAISLGLSAIDMKLITGLLFLVILICGNFKRRGKL